MFQLLLSPVSTPPFAYGRVASSPQCGLCKTRGPSISRSLGLVQWQGCWPLPASAKSIVGAPLIRSTFAHRSLGMTRVVAVTDADPPRLSTGRAFTNTYSASDVLCHRMGTVSETSGSHCPLANSGRHSLARALFRGCIDPHGQNRARAERFKNDATRDPEHLSSYLQRTKFYPRARYHPLGCPREAGDAAYPFARPLCRDAPSRAPRFRSSYAEPDSCLSADEPTRPKIRPIDDCNPTCQKRALVVSRCYRVACQSCPWRAAMSEAVHAATTRFGRRFPQCREHSPLAAPLELRHL